MREFPSEIKKVQVFTGKILLHIHKPVGFDHIPGQYTTLKTSTNAKAEYYAIYSNPTDPTLSFLIKNNAQKEKIFSENKVLLGQPMGKGFPLPTMQGKHIVLITHGTGYSAFHALLSQIQQEWKKYNLSLFYSAKNEENSMVDKTLLDKLMFIKKRITYTSQDKRLTHYLKSELPGTENATALLVGSAEFVSAITQILMEHNYTPGQILNNL